MVCVSECERVCVWTVQVEGRVRLGLFSCPLGRLHMQESRAMGGRTVDSLGRGAVPSRQCVGVGETWTSGQWVQQSSRSSFAGVVSSCL